MKYQERYYSPFGNPGVQHFPVLKQIEHFKKTPKHNNNKKQTHTLHFHNASSLMQISICIFHFKKISTSCSHFIKYIYELIFKITLKLSTSSHMTSVKPISFNFYKLHLFKITTFQVNIQLLLYLMFRIVGSPQADCFQLNTYQKITNPIYSTPFVSTDYWE